MVLIQRRALLTSALVGVVGSAASGPTAAASAVRVIDAHAHFYDPTRPQGVPWPAPGETVLYRPTYPNRYLENVSPFTVHGVVAVEASPWLEDNLWLLRVADANPLVVGVVGNIAPGHREFRDALERFSEHPLFRGLRINADILPRALADSRMSADLKLLAEKDLALDILLVGPPAFAEATRLSAAVPELRIVLEHLPIDPPRDEAARAKFMDGLREVGRCPKVYAKISSVVRRVGGKVPTDAAFYKPSLDGMLEAFGADRVIYASNWPVCDITAPYGTVFRIVRDYFAKKDRETAAKYFWKNSQAAYKWRERGARG
jgi:L-fuconolactonase